MWIIYKIVYHDVDYSILKTVRPKMFVISMVNMFLCQKNIMKSLQFFIAYMYFHDWLR